MADQDRATRDMATLMPMIRRAFKKGVEARELSSVLRVEQRESALNVRLAEPAWPGPGDDLVDPQGTPVTALRLCRELVLPVDADPECVEHKLEGFGEDTAAAYLRAVLAKLVAAAGMPATAPAKPPDAVELRTRAKALGLPCRVVVGPTLYSTVKDLSDAFLEKPVLELSWPDQRALMLSLTSKGPWVEELEPAFVIEWEPAANRSVSLKAARRLYLHNADACYLYEP